MSFHFTKLSIVQYKPPKHCMSTLSACGIIWHT